MGGRRLLPGHQASVQTRPRSPRLRAGPAGLANALCHPSPVPHCLARLAPCGWAFASHSAQTSGSCPSHPVPARERTVPAPLSPHLQSRGLTIYPHGCFQFLRVCEVTKDRPEGHQSSELPTFPSFLSVVPWTCSWEDSTFYFQQNSKTQAERAGESLEAAEETATAGGMLGEVGRVHGGACPGDDPLPAGRTESRATSTHPERKACTFSRRNLSSGPKGRLELSVDVGATLGSFLTALRGSTVLRVACDFAPGWCNGGGRGQGACGLTSGSNLPVRMCLNPSYVTVFFFFFFPWKENSMNFPSLQMAPSPSGR